MVPRPSRRTGADAFGECAHSGAITTALPRPVPSPRMKRLRMSAGSRTVCPMEPSPSSAITPRSGWASAAPSAIGQDL